MMAHHHGVNGSEAGSQILRRLDIRVRFALPHMVIVELGGSERVVL